MLEALEDTRIVFVLGARQVGKSTLAREIVENDHPAIPLSLDDETTRDAANTDPTGFIAGFQGPVLIDEVQRAPDLLLAVKESVDRDQTPGRFLLTGSANILTAPRIMEALAGRMEIVNLWPLAQVEIERRSTNLVEQLFQGSPPWIQGAPVGRDAFAERAVRGGFPEARIRSQRRRDRWFDSYLRAIVERDLAELADIEKLGEVPSLLRMLASQAANLYIVDNVSQRVGLARGTVQSYTQLLETVFLVRRVQAWRPGIGSREIQTPKIYITDSGLLCYLLGANEQRVTNDDQVTGKVFENFVAIEVAKLVDWADSPPQQYHYRHRDDEVDIVLEARSGDIVALECKTGATVRPRDYRPLEKLRSGRDERFIAGVVMYTGERTLPLSDRIWAVPVSALWA